MPHATNQYGFEWRILEWASRLSSQLTGAADFPFLMLFGPDGQIHRIHFGDGPQQHDDRAWQLLREAVPKWFFYDPFDAPEYTYIGWQGVAEAWFELVLGVSFEISDLTAAGKTIEFPMNWGVMF